MPSSDLSFIGISRFKGYWNASTNTALSGGVLFTGSHGSGGYGNGLVGEPSGSGKINVGEYWQVNTAGSTNLDGTNTWQVDDWLVYTTGSRWARIDYADTVSTIVVGSTDALMLSKDLLLSSSNTQLLFNSGSAAAGTMMSGSANLTYDYVGNKLRLTGSLIVSGTLVANEFKVNVVNESVVNISSTGSTDFGNSSDDIHKFTGKVGIGTSNPTSTLEVYGGSGGVTVTSAYPDFTMKTTGGNVPYDQNEGRLLWQDAGAGAVGAIKMVQLPVSASMRFFTSGINANQERMRIAASGNVGIGTTNPTSKLTVSGSVALTGSLLVSGSAKIIGGEGLPATLTLSADQGDDVADTATISVADGGNLTIDSAGDVILDAAGAAPEVVFKDAGSTYGYIGSNDAGGSTGIFIQPEGAATAFLRDPDDSSGAEMVRFVSATGHVGIGTTSPTARLTVSGSVAMTGSLLVSGSAAIIGGEAQPATLTLSADQGDDAADTATISVDDGGIFSVVSSNDIYLSSSGAVALFVTGTDKAFSINHLGNYNPSHPGYPSIEFYPGNKSEFGQNEAVMRLMYDANNYVRFRAESEGGLEIQCYNTGSNTSAGIMMRVPGAISMHSTEEGVWNFTGDDGTWAKWVEKSGSYRQYSRSIPHADGAYGNTGWFEIQSLSSGSTTISTNDASGLTNNANLVFDVDGDIELNADGGDITFKDASAQFASFNSSTGMVLSGSAQITGSVGISGSFTVSTEGLKTGALYVSPAGRVGVGTTNPGSTLTVTAEYPDISLRSAGECRLLWEDVGAAAYGAIKMVPSDTAPMRFFTSGITAGDEKMRITYDGNVGIGVTDPDSALEILSTTTQQKWSYDGSYSATMTVDSSGNTSLAAAGGITFDGSGGNILLDAAGDITLDAAGNEIYLKDAGTEFARFSSASDLFTIDAATDIVLDTGRDKIDFKKAGSDALSIILVSTGSGPSVQLKNMNTSAYSDLRLVNATGGINAMSINNGGYGGFAYKRAIHTVSGSNLDLSAMNLTGAMGYCGSVIKVIQTQETGGLTTLTLPTTTTEDGAQQLMGYQLRVMLDTAGAAGFKIARGDASNDYMFGYIIDASSTGTPGAVGFSGTGPGGGGHDYAFFVGGTAVTGDYVDVVCVSATDDLVKWLVTGVAST